MTTPPGALPTPADPESNPAKTGNEAPTLIPQAALRILCLRTGGTISRTTFYRWLRCGKIATIRLGARIFIPRPALESFIEKCFDAD